MAISCALEDFFTLRFGEKERNVIDDYLDQRAWKESIQGRDYLRALRDSVMSLYEVVDLAPDRVLLRDLIRGGEPVAVDEHLGSQCLAPWDRIAARIVRIGDCNCLTGVLLHFPDEPSEALLKLFRQGMRAVKRETQEAARALGIEDRKMLRARFADKEYVLATAAILFTQVWVLYTLSKLREPAPMVVNFDGDEIVFTKVKFAVEGEDRAEVIRRLDEAEALERTQRERHAWTWVAPAPAASPKRRAGACRWARWLKTAISLEASS